MAKEEGRVVGHTLTMASATGLSRILGYARDRLVANLLGTSYWADAFYIAFRIPNVFRRFMAEGAMTSALVPVLSESFRKEAIEEAWLFARRFLYVFGAFLALFGALGVLAAPLLVRAIAWNLAAGAPEVHTLTVRLTALLFPYITLVSLAAVAMGILNCRDVFGPPAFTPVLLNLCIISAGWFWGRHSENPTYALAWGVLVGGTVQFLFQLPYLKREGMSFALSFVPTDPRVRKVFRLMGPGMLGAGVTQLGILLGTALAHTLGEGAVSALYYSNRVTELAFGVFAVSVTTVILPRMSRRAADGDRASIEDLLRQALTMIFFILFPATAGIMALSRPIVRVLFETGRFSESSVALTAGPLFAFGLGLTLWGAATIFVKACHAHQDMMSPFYAGIASLAVYAAVALALMPSLGVSGIALASSVSAAVQGGVVLHFLISRHGIRVRLARLLPSILRSGLLSAAMGAGAWWAHGRLPSGSLPEAAVSLFGIIAAAVVFYLGGAVLLRFPEIAPFEEWLRRRR